MYLFSLSTLHYVLYLVTTVPKTICTDHIYSSRPYDTHNDGSVDFKYLNDDRDNRNINLGYYAIALKFK